MVLLFLLVFCQGCPPLRNLFNIFGAKFSWISRGLSSSQVVFSLTRWRFFHIRKNPVDVGFVVFFFKIPLRYFVAFRPTPSPNTVKTILGGGNSNIFFNVHFYFGEDDPIWLAHIFQMGGSKKPPTSGVIGSYPTISHISKKVTTHPWSTPVRQSPGPQL